MRFFVVVVIIKSKTAVKEKVKLLFKTYFPQLCLTSVSAGGPRLFRHTRAPDNSSPSRLECIHVGCFKKQKGRCFWWWWWWWWSFCWLKCLRRRNVVDRTADGEDGTCGAFQCCQKYRYLRGQWAHVNEPNRRSKCCVWVKWEIRELKVSGG